MTLLDLIRNAVRTYIMNAATQFVVDDIVNNGLSPADEAIIDAYLNTMAP